MSYVAILASDVAMVGVNWRLNMKSRERQQKRYNMTHVMAETAKTDGQKCLDAELGCDMVILNLF